MIASLRMPGIAVALAALVIAPATLPALGQTVVQAAPSVSPAEAANAFAAADKNHDGKLGAAEFQTLPPAVRDGAIDGNADGYYSLAELIPPPAPPAPGRRPFALCDGVRLGYLMWPVLPATLAPDEVAIEIDPASMRVVAGGPVVPLFGAKQSVYDVKRVLVGSFAGTAVATEIDYCGNGDNGFAGANILVGTVAASPGGTQVLTPRYMSTGAPEWPETLRQLAQDEAPADIFAYGAVLRGADSEKWIRAAADKGDLDALRAMSQRQYPTPQEAQAWKARYDKALQTAAAGGDVKAMFDIADPIMQRLAGLMGDHLAGWSGDLGEAVGWYRAAADRGDASAASKLGHLYLKASFTASRGYQAEYWLRRAILEGDASAGADLVYPPIRGSLPADRDWLQSDENLAFYLGRASGGDVTVMLRLADTYRLTNTARSADAVRRWYRAAADAGDPAGLLGLATLQPQTQAGVMRSATLRAQAVALLTTRAAGGDSVAILRLARVYDEAELGVADPARALALFRQAAGQGNLAAMRAIGDDYAWGRGVAKDGAQALSWYRRAADQGDMEAMTDLADAYEFGWFVPKDDEAGALWRRKILAAGGAY